MYLRQRRALQKCHRWKGTLYQKDVGHNHKLLSNSFDKKYRQTIRQSIVEQFNMKLAQKSALMYEAVQRKYKVFRLFNKLHVSNSFYENQFAKLLELAKRVGRADRLYRK